MKSQMIADLPTPDKIFSHEFTLVGLETGQNLRMGAIYVIFMLQKCVSYIMCYIILGKCLTHSWQIQWILWIGKKEIIEDPKDFLCNISKTKEENLHFFVYHLHWIAWKSSQKLEAVLFPTPIWAHQASLTS